MKPRVQWVCVDCGAEMVDDALAEGDSPDCVHCTVLHHPGTPDEYVEEGRCEEDAHRAGP